MEKPDQFAEVLLAETGMDSSQVKELWDKASTAPSHSIGRLPGASWAYFTAIADEKARYKTFADLYGLDRKLAAALFGDANGFPLPPSKPKKPQEEAADASQPVRRIAAGNGIAGSLRGLFGE